MKIPRKPLVDFSHKRFLVIDDFGDMRSMLRHMVESYGVGHIDTAASNIAAATGAQRKESNRTAPTSSRTVARKVEAPTQA